MNKPSQPVQHLQELREDYMPNIKIDLGQLKNLAFNLRSGSRRTIFNIFLEFLQPLNKNIKSRFMRQPEVKNSADKHLTFERNSSSNKRQYLPNLCRCWYFLKKVNVELSLRTFLLEISPKAGVFFIVFIDLNLVIIVLSLFCCRKEV